MLITDIKQTCHVCQGTGQKHGFKQHASIQINAKSACYECRGRGFQLTDLGAEIWKVFEPLVDERVKKHR